jgi:hypothetical protein
MKINRSEITTIQFGQQSVCLLFIHFIIILSYLLALSFKLHSECEGHMAILGGPLIPDCLLFQVCVDTEQEPITLNKLAG